MRTRYNRPVFDDSHSGSPFESVPLRVTVIGPVHPFRGGIAHHTTLLTEHLLGAGHTVQLISFRRQYPGWLVRNRTDRDPSHAVLRTDALFVLDPLAPWTWRRVCHLIEAQHTDLVVFQWWVTFWAAPWIYISRFIRRTTRARVVFLCHNVLPHESSWLDRALAGLVLSQGYAAIVHAKQELATLDVVAPRLPAFETPLPTYRELAQVSLCKNRGEDLRTSFGLTAKTHVLLFFGFVRPYKGVDVLLRALPHIRAVLPAVHLFVVGEIWSGGQVLRDQVRQDDIAGNVTFVDRYVPNEELAIFFEAADVVVLPYRSATQSAVVQVAYGFGVPVIASAVGGLPDAVEDGRTGLLVAPGDPEQLARAVLRYLQERLGPAMRQRIAAMNDNSQNRFSWDSTVHLLERLALEGR